MRTVLCTLHARRSHQAVALAAGCLAAALPADLRRDCRLVDGYPDQPDGEILAALLAEEPAVVAFSVYTWNRLRASGLACALNRIRPELILVAGGPEATGDPPGLATSAPWTALVHGEGEVAFARLLTAIARGPLTEPLPGVTLMTADGPLTGPPAAPYDLDTATSPWTSGLLAPTTSGGVLWEVTRGCAFACDYCFDGRGHAGVRPLPRRRLAEELACFVRAGVSQVWVLDSTFNYPPERGVALLQLLLAEAPGLHYHLEAKADFIDRRTARLLGRLHCSVQLGLQSIRAQVLKAIHRPLDLDVLAEKVHLLEAEGVIFGFDLIYGLPEDDYAGFRESLDTVLGFAPNHVHVFPLAVLPGTKLHQQRERHRIVALAEPPYEQISSHSWSSADMESCRRLSAAADLFYNTGRAVAFFPAVLQALQTGPSELFEDFFAWAGRQEGIDSERLLDSEQWSAEEVFRLQQGYLEDGLRQRGQGHLVSLFRDLLSYHFHYAETMLGDELPAPSDEYAPPEDTWETPWRRTAQYRLVPFAYEILDLLEMEGMQLAEIAELFRPVGSVALFMRRDGEVFCESLSEEMQRLLMQSDGTRSPKEIFAGSLSRETGEELVRFAVGEGLLQQPV